MKRCACIVGILALALGLVLYPALRAQNYPTTYNPYTGKASTFPGYNPYTGAGPAGRQPNPLLGSPAMSPTNPLTGKPMPAAANYNPLTGGYRPVPTGGAPALPPSEMWAVGKFPVHGKAAPGLEPIDRAVLAMMTRRGIPGASLAIARDGKLIYAKGFGWAELAAQKAATPTTLFGLASLSKPITAWAILLLIERGQLDVDDRVFDLLKHIRPPAGARVDPRLKTITVRQLLNHSGGWDRDKSGDPLNWSARIAQGLRVPLPVTDVDLISYMMALPLDFAPGTQFKYSNVGYVLLGQIIEKVSGRRYEDFVAKEVLLPSGVTDALLSKGRRPYQQGESRCYLAGSGALLPPLELPMVKAAGGWCMSSVNVARLLTALDGSRGQPLLKKKTFELMLAPPPPPLRPAANGTYNGLGMLKVLVTSQGYTYMHDGLFNGMRTFMKRNQKGINWVLLFNVTMEPDLTDERLAATAVQEVRQRIEQLAEVPDVDYFKDFE